MLVRIDGCELELIQGDITDQDTEAIVNAANESLLGGGGVDGAIHRIGGPSILEESRRLGGCNTGDAKITSAGDLNADYVIHAVGPVYRGGSRHEADLLASAYRRSMEIAVENYIRSLAFPSISTGAYGYPVREAAEVALRTVIDFVQSHTGIELVRFVLYDPSTYQIYESVLQELTQQPWR